MTKRPSVMSLDDLMTPNAVAIPEPVEMPTAEPEPEPERPSGRKPVPDTFRTSIYFHRTVHDALRKIAFDERSTISDLINEGLDLVLKGRGFPSAAELKARGARKRKRNDA